MRMVMRLAGVLMIVSSVSIAAQERTPPAKTDAATVAGRWTLSMKTPHGDMTLAMDLALDGKKVSGWLSSEQFGRLPLAGEYAASVLKFTVNTSNGDLAFTGKLKDRDTIVGDMAGHAGDLPCLATRVKEKK